MSKDLIKDNLLIAEFLGETINGGQVLKIQNKKAKWVRPIYSESWDWLMPAVKMCSELSTKATDGCIKNMFSTSILGVDIKAAFKNVVAFLKTHQSVTSRYFQLVYPNSTEAVGAVAIKNPIIPAQGRMELKNGWNEYLADLASCSSESDVPDVDMFVDFFNDDSRDTQILIERVVFSSV